MFNKILITRQNNGVHEANFLQAIFLIPWAQCNVSACGFSLEWKLSTTKPPYSFQWVITMSHHIYNMLTLCLLFTSSYCFFMVAKVNALVYIAMTHYSYTMQTLVILNKLVLHYRWLKPLFHHCTVRFHAMSTLSKRFS